MNKISLLDKVKALATKYFSFVDIDIEKTKDGDSVATLTLETPIAMVRGSQKLDIGGKKVPLIAYDVTTVKVHENDMVEGFAFDEDGTAGEYNGDTLFLDVTKNGDVWMRSQTFASSGNDFRQKRNDERTADIVKRQIERKNAAAAAPANGVLQPV